MSMMGRWTMPLRFVRFLLPSSSFPLFFSTSSFFPKTTTVRGRRALRHLRPQAGVLDGHGGGAGSSGGRRRLRRRRRRRRRRERLCGRGRDAPGLGAPRGDRCRDLLRVLRQRREERGAEGAADNAHSEREFLTFYLSSCLFFPTAVTKKNQLSKKTFFSPDRPDLQRALQDLLHLLHHPGHPPGPPCLLRVHREGAERAPGRRERGRRPRQRRWWFGAIPAVSGKQ